MPRVHDVNMPYPADVNLDHQADQGHLQGHLSQLPTVKLLPLLPFPTALLGRKASCRVLFLIYSTIQYQYELIDLYPIFWVIIQYIILMLKLFQLSPLAALSVGLCPFDISTSTYVCMYVCTYVCVFSISLLSGTTTCTKCILYISCLSPRISGGTYISIQWASVIWSQLYF